MTCGAASDLVARIRAAQALLAADGRWPAEAWAGRYTLAVYQAHCLAAWVAAVARRLYPEKFQGGDDDRES
jgi:hypothetical protein